MIFCILTEKAVFEFLKVFCLKNIHRLFVFKCFFVNINGYYDEMEAFFGTIESKGFVRGDNAAVVVFVRTIDELFRELARIH